MKYRAPVEARTQKFHIRYLDLLREIARKNRKNPTEAENKIWQVFFKNRKIKEKFTRQKPIGRFIIDFYCSKLLLAIEIDGESHDNKQYQDKERDLYLEQRGIKTIRYTNEQILNNIDYVYKDLINKIKQIEKEPCVSPLPARQPAWSRGDVRRRRTEGFNIKNILFFIFFFFLFPKPSLAQVKITNFNYLDPEWVEITNQGVSDVDINFWRLRDENAFTKNQIGYTLSAFISSNQTIKYNNLNFILNDGGDTIYLHDQNNNLIDSLIYPLTTPTTTPTATPSATPSATPTETPTATPSATPTSLPDNYCNNYNNIILTEVMPNPSSGNEWIEILNNNDCFIFVDNWKIVDDSGKARSIGSTQIAPFSYFVYTISSHYLNNDSDSVKIIDSNNLSIGNTFSYTYTKKGYSFSYQMDEGKWCLTEISKEADNSSCYQEPPEPIVTPKPTSPPTGGPKITATATPKASTVSTSYKTPTSSTSPTETEEEGQVLGEITFNNNPSSPSKNYLSLFFIILGSIFLFSPLIVL